MLHKPANFRIASIQHYLIVNADKRADKRLVVHHRRNGAEIATRILAPGEDELGLDPPGINIAPADFFTELPPLSEDA